MNQTGESRAGAEHVHFMDAARAALMLLGIPFHAALIFTSLTWVVTSPVHSQLLAFLPPLVTSFRMPAFFLIAGFFAALLLERRSPGQWLRMRAIRLGIPLITGLAVIVPLQDLVLANAPQDVAHLPRTLGGIVLSHLWFLPVLLAHCALLAGAWELVARLRFPDLPVWLIGIGCGVWTVGVHGAASLASLDLAPFERLLEFDAVLDYAPHFLLGVAIRRNPALFERFCRWNWPTVTIGMLALVCSVLSDHLSGDAEQVVWFVSEPLAAVCLSQALLAVFARIADRPSPLVGRLVDASFSIYLFHHPLIVVLSLVVLDAGMGPVASWLAICVATLAISYALHRGLRRSRLLLLLFNGSAGTSAQRPSSDQSQSPPPAARPA
jgi:glucans biosynthesis protein C